MKTGPTFYQGWTCNGCDRLEMLEYPESIDYRCNETHDFINDIYHTPKECPYLKSEIIRRVMEIEIIAEVPCPKVGNNCVGLNFCCECELFGGFSNGNKVTCNYE